MLKISISPRFPRQLKLFIVEMIDLVEMIVKRQRHVDYWSLLSPQFDHNNQRHEQAVQVRLEENELDPDSRIESISVGHEYWEKNETAELKEIEKEMGTKTW